MKFLKQQAEEFRLKAEAMDKYITNERRKRTSDIHYKSIPTISSFFRGACVLITGGTGFVGKVLTEKLLRCCPDIERIYFLVREKKGKAGEDRLADLFKSALFEKLMKENPAVVRKVIPIIGDVAEVGLGLSEDDRMLLQHTTTVTFHSAATVRFDEPFSKAVLLNCRGTREIVDLCKSMVRLKALVHVSTTYCNTDRAINEEIVYPAHLNWRDVIKIAENDDPNSLQSIHSILIGKLPNIYTFTKRLAENIVNDARHEIPVVIGRPCVVISTVSDPLEGWWDNMIGPSGLYVGLSTGVLRVFYADANVKLDYFAVDYVIKELILIAWIRGTGLRISSDPDEIDVVNMSILDLYGTTVGSTLRCDVETNKLYPPMGVRHPSITLTKNKSYFMYRLITSHVLFALIVDAVLTLIGKDFRLLKIYRRVMVANIAVKFFATNHYTSISEKYIRSLTFTKDEDFERFGQTLTFDLVKYSIDAKIGIDKYLLKRTPDYELNRWLQRLLLAIHWIWQGLKLYAVYRLLRWML